MSRKILIVSDSHRRDRNLKEVIDKVKPFDVLIHLGDGEGSDEAIAAYAGEGVACYFVQGNNDFFSQLDREKELVLGGKRCFLTHGHNYGVGLDARMLAQEAKARGCQIAMFGHTHRPYMKEIDGVLCLNPGSISFPRQSNRKPSFIVAEEDDKGALHFAQNYLDTESDGIGWY